MTGKVKFFDAKKGWGFISPRQGGEDVYVHYTGIVGNGFRTLMENDLVEFQIVSDERKQSGKERAEKVVVLTGSERPEPALKHIRD